MSLQQDREELRQLLKSKSVKTGKFTLASGKESYLLALSVAWYGLFLDRYILCPSDVLAT